MNLNVRNTEGFARHTAGRLNHDARLKRLDATMKRYQYQHDSLIEVLHKAQELFGYLEDDVLRYVARRLKLPLSYVYGVATFYHLFSLTPPATHACVICMGTACYVKEAAALLKMVKQYTGIYPGQTTANGQLMVQTARCLGVCGIAPAVVFDSAIEGYQTPDGVRDWLNKIEYKNRVQNVAE